MNESSKRHSKLLSLTFTLNESKVWKMYVAIYETSSQIIWNDLLDNVYHHLVCCFSYESLETSKLENVYRM